MASGLEAMAKIAARRVGTAPAAQLREARDAALPPELQVGHQQARHAMRLELGEEVFAVTWAEGQALPLDEAILVALADHPVAADGE